MVRSITCASRLAGSRPSLKSATATSYAIVVRSSTAAMCAICGRKSVIPRNGTAAAMASAVNDWQVAEWLDREPRSFRRFADDRLQSLAQHREEVGPLLLTVVEARGRDPLEHRILQLRAIQRVHRPEPTEVEWALEAVGVVLAELERMDERITNAQEFVAECEAEVDQLRG